MSQLLTQCPFCKTSFKVSDQQLAAANGVVRCGACREVFLARKNRIVLKEKPSPESALPPASPDNRPAENEALSVEADYPPAPLFDDGEEPAMGDFVLDAEDEENEEDADTAEFGQGENEEPVTPDEPAQPAVYQAEEEPATDENIFDYLEALLEEEEQGSDQSPDSVTPDEPDAEPEELPDIEEPGETPEIEEPAEEPEIEEPGEAPEIDEPTEEPEIDEPGQEPEIEEPGTLPEIEVPEIEEPVIEEPEIEPPGTEEPEIEEPGQEPEIQEPDMPPEIDEPEVAPEIETPEPPPEIQEPDTQALAAAQPSRESGEEEATSEEPDQAAFATLLDPSGYSMNSFTIDHELQEDSWTDEQGQPAAAEAEVNIDAPEARVTATAESAYPADPDLPDQQAPGSDASNEDEPASRATGTEAVDNIPTLVPDVVASENIPTGMNQQNVAWFQSLRENAGSMLERLTDFSGTDDKTEIHSNLSGLRDEDSLEPVAQQHLEAIDAEPVELVSVSDPMKAWKVAGMGVCSLLLLAGLASQYFWFNLDSLLAERRFNAITTLLCRFSDCPDASVVDLTSLVTEELVVRSHPTQDNALEVNFIFRNDADREQRFPLVELNFTDITGDVVANRVFTRNEYLPEEMQLFTHMPAHSSMQVSLELVDPGEDVTGYSLVFRNP